ncbi:MAG: PBP1A family penicillin-binding protein [Candidatus Doudnabacteria bacterium]|nr:PBP1A family penicillin-binding protein [Candidatus Doudnabacteria bacterium]
MQTQTLKKIFYYSSAVLAGFSIVAFVQVRDYVRSLPDTSILVHGTIPASSKIFDRNGELLYEIHGEYKRSPVELEEINQNLIDATIAIEDKSFYNHHGLSIEAIGRAAWVNYKARSISQGGSTITQQLAKNALLTRERSWERKIKEALLAIKLEQEFSKKQILGMYLNQIPYGRNAYGVEAASETYFGKAAKDLTLAESAYIAALPQAPSYYMRTDNRDALTARKNDILRLMYEQKYISEGEYNTAKDEKVVFRKTKTELQAPHFVMWVEKYLNETYDKKHLEEGGFKVYTTLDMNVQRIAEDVIAEGVEKNSTKYNAHNASLVAMDTKTGQILAMVGGKNYFGQAEPAGCVSGLNCLFDPNVNAAISDLQAGSSMKPYTYLTAFGPEFKYAPSSIVMDVSKNFAKGKAKPYVPKNYNGKQYGAISMRKAFAGSLNISAVRTLEAVGIPSMVNTMRKLGITSSFDNCGLSLTLGGCEVKLLEHTAAYSVIGNGGLNNGTHSILRIEDRNGKILEEYQAQNVQAVDARAAYQVINVMTDNDARSFVFGKRSPLILEDRPIAAKTGTTQKFHDGWTLGFTPQITAGVWAGNNDGTLLRAGADGVFVAAPIWNAFMKKVHQNLPVETFGRPEGILEAKVAANGQLAFAGGKTEIFADYNLPNRRNNNIPLPTKLAATTTQVQQIITPEVITTPPTEIDGVGGISDDENPLRGQETDLTPKPRRIFTPSQLQPIN